MPLVQYFFLKFGSDLSSKQSHIRKFRKSILAIKNKLYFIKINKPISIYNASLQYT